MESKERTIAKLRQSLNIHRNELHRLDCQLNSIELQPAYVYDDYTEADRVIDDRIDTLCDLLGGLVSILDDTLSTIDDILSMNEVPNTNEVNITASQELKPIYTRANNSSALNICYIVSDTGRTTHCVRRYDDEKLHAFKNRVNAIIKSNTK